MKTKYQTKKTDLEKKIPDLSDPVKKTKHTELENKIPDASRLATNTARTLVEKEKPNVRGLVIKTDYDTKISELENKLTNQTDDKYNTTSEFNTLAASVFSARLAQANLIIKNRF